jgi:hypothetical protein
MRRPSVAFVVVAVLLSSAAARAQAPEPTPPGAEPTPPGAEPPPPGGPPQTIDVSPPGELGKYQLGVRARYLFVTQAMMSPFLAANTGTAMNSYSLGMEFTYRPTGRHWDVVTSLDFSWLDVQDGNYLGAGHDPSLDTHYTQFRNLSFISADVSIIGWHKFLPWLELRYGGGLGIGYVPGDVLITNNGPQCTAANASDTTKCFPVGVGAINGKPTAQQEQQLQNTMNGGTDTNTDPHRHSGDKPPVMGVVNLLVGLRFYPVPRMAVTWELGFRDAMFTGVSLGYLF